jgi:hypothetical protein
MSDIVKQTLVSEFKPPGIAAYPLGPKALEVLVVDDQ